MNILYNDVENVDIKNKSEQLYAYDSAGAEIVIKLKNTYFVTVRVRNS